MSIVIKSLAEVSLADALKAWNDGFEGYFVNIRFSMDPFVWRMGMEGLSPELSVVAYSGSRPVGIVVNGIRTIGDRKIAWNGGTGVATDMRRQGVGRQLVDVCLDLYRDHGVHTAYLEAIAENHRAIALYESVGYTTIDRVTALEQSNPLPPGAFSPSLNGRYTLKDGDPADVAKLPFYQAQAAWQTQWPSVRDGRSVVVYDAAGTAMGYALYKRGRNPAGEVTHIALYQCEVKDVPEAAQEAWLNALLSEVYPAGLECRRVTVNLRASNAPLLRVLARAGFTPRVQQVMMARDMEE